MTANIPVTPEVLLLAYRQGIFPMARSRRGRIDWYSPDPRAILPLDAFHVPASLGRRYRSGRFRVTRNRAFAAVIRACRQPRRAQAETWINASIVAAYTRLHEMGFAHSVEAWCPVRLPEGSASGSAVTPVTEAPEGLALALVPEGLPRGTTARKGGATGDAPATPLSDDLPDGPEDGRFELVGGLYGVALGGAFFGESMFSRATDASKVCLVHLVKHLRAQGFVLLDVQMNSPHMARFGTIDVPRDQFMELLAAALEKRAEW